MIKCIFLLIFAVQSQAKSFDCEVESRPNEKVSIQFNDQKVFNIFYVIPSTWEDNQPGSLNALYQSVNGIRGEYTVDSCRLDENHYLSADQTYRIISDCEANGTPVLFSTVFKPAAGGELQYTQFDGSKKIILFGNCESLL